MDSQPLAGEHITGKWFTLPEESEHVYSVAVSGDGAYLACAFGNGVLRVLDAASLSTIARAASGAPYSDLPCTSVKWFPQQKGTAAYRLASVSSGGALFGWEFDGDTLDRTHHVQQDGNEILIVDVDVTGQRLLTAGSDRVVRLYNEAFELIAELQNGCAENGTVRPTHTNRVFSARFVTATSAASAGWQSPIQVWDLRTKRSDRQIFCTPASSDCLEPVSGTTLLLVATGEAGCSLQLYDSVSCSLRKPVSSRLCDHLGKDERVIVTRVSGSERLVWCLSISPSTITVISLADGHILGRVTLPFIAMNMALNPAKTNEAVVAGQRGQLAVLTLTGQ